MKFQAFSNFSAATAALVLLSACSSPAIMGSKPNTTGFHIPSTKTSKKAIDIASNYDSIFFLPLNKFKELAKTNDMAYIPEGQCSSSGPATNLSVSQVHAYIEAHNKSSKNKIHLLTLAQYKAASMQNFLPKEADYIMTLLADCFEDEEAEFSAPSEEQRWMFGLPENWPHKIDESGFRCRSAVCESCIVAWTSQNEVGHKLLYKGVKSPNNVGALFLSS